MLVLALDTTTAAGSVALADETRVIDVLSIDPSKPVATQLPAHLAAIVERHGVALDRIGAFAVATGPGSFTGLRIGIATMQGLAVGMDKPLVGVSAFEALTTFVGAPRAAVWIDAWRGEVYAALYVAAGDAALHMEGEPVVAAPDVLLRRAAAAPPATYIGDGAVKYRELIEPALVVQPTPLIAGAVATVALRRLARGEAPPPHAIRPLYVRRPDAELTRERSAG